MREFELDPEGPEHMAILFFFFFGLSRFGDTENSLRDPWCLSPQFHDTDKSWMELDHQIGELPFVWGLVWKYCTSEVLTGLLALVGWPTNVFGGWFREKTYSILTIDWLDSSIHLMTIWGCFIWCQSSISHKLLCNSGLLTPLKGFISLHIAENHNVFCQLILCPSTL